MDQQRFQTQPTNLIVGYMVAFALIGPTLLLIGFGFISSLFATWDPSAPLFFSWRAASLPSASAIEVAAHYQANAWRISLGAVICLASTITNYPAFLVLASQIRRIERAHGEQALNSWLFAIMSTMAVGIGSLMPFLTWITAAYRPDRHPDVTQALNDLAWFSFVMPFPPFAVMVLAIGIAILRDKFPKPLYPRWLGWLCIWEVFAVTPAALSAFFYTGPFAWNGFLSLWFVALGISIFFSSLLLMTFKAIYRGDDYESQSLSLPK